MGITVQPRLELYWTTKYPLSIHGDPDVMPISRFQQLFGCLRLADNSAQIPRGQSGHDQLFKVRTLLDLVVQKFESEYVIYQNCTINDAIVRFKGRLCFTQCLEINPQNGESKYLGLMLQIATSKPFKYMLQARE